MVARGEASLAHRELRSPVRAGDDGLVR